MLISTRVIELNKEVKELKNKRYQECEMVSRKLDPINRLRLKKINELINKLSMSIEDTTGWVYTPSCFVFKTNYFYDEQRDEITYDLNKVVRAEKGYTLSKVPTSFEHDFIEKNLDVLVRLFKLEQKRDKILEPYLKKYGDVFNYYLELVSEMKKDNTPAKCNYIHIASKQFESRFGAEGIKRLVNLLNYLVTTTYTEPLDNYNDQFYGNVTNIYVDELFRWAAAFTPRAQYILDVITKKREEMEKPKYPEQGQITLQ